MEEDSEENDQPEEDSDEDQMLQSLLRRKNPLNLVLFNLGWE